MDDKAQFFVLESILAIVMILFSLIFVYTFAVEPTVNTEASTQLKSSADEALFILRNTESNEDEIPAPENCILRWDFEEGSGTKAVDTSGNNNNGTIHGNCSFTSRSVHENYAMNFDGNSDYINCSNDTELDVSTYFTISAWIDCEDSNVEENFFLSKGNQFVFGIYNGTGNSDAPLHPYNRPTIIWYDTKKSEYHYFGGETEIKNQTWYHLAATYDGSAVKIYVNGKLDKTYYVDDSPNYRPGKDLEIGRRTIPTTNYFQGKMDNICVWNITLNEKEINASYYLGIDSIFENVLTQWIISNDKKSRDEFTVFMDKMLPATVCYQVKVFDGANTYYWYNNDKEHLAKEMIKSHYIISHLTRIYSVELEIWTI